ncbi:septal ring lytic transglycosylase RlpA family protein [Dokdonella sp.]|uniref:septal ring lytic transglycosylase RlpA family protein n=1 Tax=Dokdonella sp. TaxID=2291710 RepID=UPI003AF60D44
MLSGAATRAACARGRSLAARLPVLACLVLLAACASHGPRPEAPAGAAGKGAAGHHDDTSRSQSERYRQSRDGGPDGPPFDVSKIAEPVPRAEPRARYGNKPVYSVRGKTYRVLDDPAGYVARGTASWYGSKFHGYLTSSFEPYDMYAFSAAHKTLPLPCYARVTNLDNGKSVIVRVNDRGPFHDDRLIDLSYAAAVKIGVWPNGTAPVEVRVVDPGAPPSRSTLVTDSPEPAVTQGAGATALIYLQLGSFGERANAERLAARARAAGLAPVGIEPVRAGSRTLHRVRVGPLADSVAADALAARAAALGFDAPRVAHETVH